MSKNYNNTGFHPNLEKNGDPEHHWKKLITAIGLATLGIIGAHLGGNPDGARDFFCTLTGEAFCKAPEYQVPKLHDMKLEHSK